MSDAARRTARTVLQNILALAAGLPLIIDAADLPAATPGIGVSLAVAGALTRIMALPVIDRILPSWLRAAPAKAPLPPVTSVWEG
jgi:ABC-type phosphate transport system permease subunit